jgi:hypothetical protein
LVNIPLINIKSFTMKRKVSPICAKALLFILTVFLFTDSFAQSGIKWATAGNVASSGDFLGTTNNQPLVFKTNNIQWMRLSTTGTLQLNSMSGTGNRLLQTDASGNIIPFIMGTPTEVLYGNGVWGALPSIASSFWVASGSNIYYNGFVGIGIHPTMALDVLGDARISNNLYVGGGIVITDKVNASTEVKTASIVADSIKMDSTKAVYGKAIFTNEVKLKQKLNVDGDVIIGGSTEIHNMLTAPSINTTNLTTSNFNISNTLNANKISAYRLTGIPGDSIIHLGDSTINIDYYNNRITTSASTGGIIKGFSIGFGTQAKALRSLVLGTTLQTDPVAIGSIIIGSGTSTGPFINDKPNTLMIGFNTTTIPTIFVSAAPAGIGSTGNVGISTKTPEDKLQVGNGLNKIVMGSAYGSSLGFGSSYIGFNASRQTLSSWSTAGDGSHNGGSMIYSNVLGDLFFSNIPNSGGSDQTGISDGFVKNNIKMVIQANGNVGIGTDLVSNDFAYKLSVNGGIRAKFIKVNSGWADYVFEKNYSLIPLPELDKFILKNGHLPEVPTASEIEKNGIDLAEIVQLQMKKIEELTLYVIELNKKIEANGTK